MSEPQDEPTPDRVTTPTISTAPTGGETPPAPPRWWHRTSLPDHLGRARTSTVVLSVLFVAVFALYLNVRPDVGTTGTSPAGGSSDVEAPANPLVPVEPTPEPTDEPAPTPDETEPAEETGTPTTSSPSTRPTTPSTGPSTPEETTAPTGTTDGTTEGTTEQGTPASTP